VGVMADTDGEAAQTAPDNSADAVVRRVDAVVDDLLAGRVAPRSVGNLDRAVGRAKQDQAVSRPFR
jgi:hypothetical protein